MMQVMVAGYPTLNENHIVEPAVLAGHFVKKNLRLG